MISILNRIAARAKKLIILMVILPLVTGAIAAYLESKKPTTYTSTATFYIGNFNNNDLKNETSDLDLFKKDGFLNKFKKASNRTFNNDDVKARLTITGNKNNITFQYTGLDKKEVNTTLTDVSDGFKEYFNTEYNKKKALLDKVYSDTDKIKTDQEPASKQSVLYDVGMTLLTIKPLVLDEVSEPVAAYNNPLKRGIFGLILGLMLDVAILVIPELFREYR